MPVLYTHAQKYLYYTQGNNDTVHNHHKKYGTVNTQNNTGTVNILIK